MTKEAFAEDGGGWSSSSEPNVLRISFFEGETLKEDLDDGKAPNRPRVCPPL